MLKFNNILTGAGKKPVYIFSTMVLFFVIFEGITSYLIPLVIIEHGFSTTMLGLILASAAVSGAFFDLMIYRIFKNAFYRRLFIVMFASSFFYLFLIWSANLFLLFLAAMIIWGFFYDLKNFGTLDFVSRYSPKKELSSNFGILQIFQSIGYLLAPLIAGFVILDKVGWEPFFLAAVFLSISAFFFIMLLLEVRNKKQFIPPHETPAEKNISEEIALWKKVGIAILPVLLLSTFSTVFDSFFMAMGPIVAETLALEPFDGFFMVAYLLPPMLIGGLIGNITKKFGEKRTALLGLLIGSSILSTFFLFGNPLVIIFVVFASSCFTSIMSPVIQSINAKNIHECPKFKKEVQELGDFFWNCGYIVGPILAGIIADSFGTAVVFSILGGMGILFAILLFIIMPKKFSLKSIVNP